MATTLSGERLGSVNEHMSGVRTVAATETKGPWPSVHGPSHSSKRSRNSRSLNVGNLLKIVSNTLRVKQSVTIGFFQQGLSLCHLLAE